MREARDRRHRRPVQRAAERLGERRVGDRLGRAGVDRAGPVVAVERGEVDADEVVGVDPRQVLVAAGDRAADAELERRQHLGQRAARLVEHDAGAHVHDAQPELLRGRGLALPDHADLGEEVVAGPACPRRGARRRAGRSSRRAEGDTSTPGRGSAARRPATRLRVPTSRLARIRCLASSLQRCATFSPARCTTASRPASAAGGRGAGRVPFGGVDAERRARAVGIAGEHGDLVAALEQPRERAGIR